MTRIAVLAYSGELDRSCASSWLEEDRGPDEEIVVAKARRRLGR